MLSDPLPALLRAACVSRVGILLSAADEFSSATLRSLPLTNKFRRKCLLPKFAGLCPGLVYPDCCPLTRSRLGLQNARPI